MKKSVGKEKDKDKRKSESLAPPNAVSELSMVNDQAVNRAHSMARTESKQFNEKELPTPLPPTTPHKIPEPTDNKSRISNTLLTNFLSILKPQHLLIFSTQLQSLVLS